MYSAADYVEMLIIYGEWGNEENPHALFSRASNKECKDLTTFEVGMYKPRRGRGLLPTKKCYSRYIPCYLIKFFPLPPQNLPKFIKKSFWFVTCHRN
jgi:acyl CoA:acetate/3-ketoacid CoA transferase alpha subunit